MWRSGTLYATLHAALEERNAEPWDLILLGHNAVNNGGRRMVPFDVRQHTFRVNLTGSGCHAYIARPQKLLRVLSLRNMKDERGCVEDLQDAGLRMVVLRTSVVWQGGHKPSSLYDWQLVECPANRFLRHPTGFSIASAEETVMLACSALCHQNNCYTDNQAKRTVLPHARSGGDTM